MAKRGAWFPCFPSDWLLDEHVAALSLEEQGAYWRLLCHQWLQGHVSLAERDVATALGVDVRRARRLAAALERFFPPGPDALRRNPKLAEIRTRRDEWSASARAGALDRWKAERAAGRTSPRLRPDFREKYAGSSRDLPSSGGGDPTDFEAT